jgi:hypothetical protein
MPQNSIKKIFSGLFWTISLTRMGILIWLGAYFQAKTLGHTSQPFSGLCIPFWVHLVGAYCPNAQKHQTKTNFCMSWTISLTRMGLLIWSGAYF